MNKTVEGSVAHLLYVYYVVRSRSKLPEKKEMNVLSLSRIKEANLLKEMLWKKKWKRKMDDEPS